MCHAEHSVASGEKMVGKADIVNVSGGGSSNGYTTGTCIRYLKQWMLGVYISTVDVGLIDGVGCTKERYFKERYVKESKNVVVCLSTIFITQPCIACKRMRVHVRMYTCLHVRTACEVNKLIHIHSSLHIPSTCGLYNGGWRIKKRSHLHPFF